MSHLLREHETAIRIKELEWVLKIHLERKSELPNFRERIKHRIDYLEAKTLAPKPSKDDVDES